MNGVARSQRLIGFHSIADNDAHAFTCPENCITLVKSAAFFNQNTVAGRAYLAVQLPTGGVNLTLIDEQLPSLGLKVWEAWIVLNPGDMVVAILGVTTMIAWVSGAVLTGGPQFPPGAQLEPGFEPLPVRAGRGP